MATSGAGGAEAPTPARPGRYTRLRASVGRHPADLIRMGTAAAIILLCLLIARAHGVNPVESAVFAELEQLPAWSTRTWQVLTWFGSWPGIAAAAGFALYLGRLRLATSLVAAGTTSWVLTTILHWLTAPRLVPPGIATMLLRQPPLGGFDFPSEHAAVIAALVTAASPYLLRATRTSSWVLVVLVGAADVYLGHNLPVGAFAGAALGWGTGALGHLVLGAPGRRTSEQAVRMALDEVGLPGATIATVGRGWLRPDEYDLTTPTGERLHMKVVRRLHRVAGPASRLRRLLASVEHRHEPMPSTTRHEVQHEAYVTLLAERAGIGVLPVVMAGDIDHGPPFLIRRHVEGRRLSSLAADAVDDAVLGKIWRDLVLLGRQHVAHHGLRATTILIDDDGRPRITDFAVSRVGGPSAQVPQDVAELLVTLTSVVGAQRAVDSAIHEVSAQCLQQALPHLQWLALHRGLRRQLNQNRTALAELREYLASKIDCPPPRFRSPVRPATLAITLAVGLAVYLLLPELSSVDQVRDALAHADWRWLAVAVATGFLGIVASAVTILGSSRTALPVGKTMAVQLAAAFTGRTTAAGIGFYGINVAYLERLGSRRTQAVAVVLLNRAVVGVITGIATAIGVLVIGSAVPVGGVSIPTGWPVILLVVVVVAAAAVFLTLPVGRRLVWGPVRSMLRELVRDLVPTLRRPVRALQLGGGAIVFLVLQAVGLAATLAAFEPTFPLIPVMAVYVVASTLGQLAPTPGGLGAVEAATVAGLTAVGVAAAPAVAAVLTSRLLTFWLPALPGLAAFRLLQHHDVI